MSERERRLEAAVKELVSLVERRHPGATDVIERAYRALIQPGERLVEIRGGGSYVSVDARSVLYDRPLPRLSPRGRTS